MGVVGPRLRVRALEPVRRALAHLAAGASHEVVDAVVRRVLEVVLVAAEDRPDAALLEQRQQLLHVIGVAVLGPGAERRMMAEGDSPPHALVRCEGLFDPLAMLGILEETLAAEEAFLRRIEADELDVAAEAKAIEE